MRMQLCCVTEVPAFCVDCKGLGLFHKYVGELITWDHNHFPLRPLVARGSDDRQSSGALFQGLIKQRYSSLVLAQRKNHEERRVKATTNN